MKKVMAEFIRRGLTACGLGPIVLAVFYLVLHKHADLQLLSVQEVCVGIFSLSALAFVAGGMNTIYQMERLPLMAGILIHGVVLYISYLGTYLLNDWLEWSKTPILAFTVIFIFGYLVIWAIIYGATKRHTAKLNQILKQKKQSAE